MLTDVAMACLLRYPQIWVKGSRDIPEKLDCVSSRIGVGNIFALLFQKVGVDLEIFAPKCSNQLVKFYDSYTPST